MPSSIESIEKDDYCIIIHAISRPMNKCRIYKNKLVLSYLDEKVSMGPSYMECHISHLKLIF